MPSDDVRRALYAALRGEPPPDNAIWREIWTAAESQGVLADLYLAMRPVADRVPDAVAQELRRHYRAATARGLKVRHDLDQVLGALGDAGVPTVVLKGAATAACYPDPAIRPFADIDLLVRNHDVDAACQTLLQRGFRLERPTAWMREHHMHLPALLSDAGHTVELHWSLTEPGEPLTVSSGPIWERLIRLEYGGLGFLALDPLDHLLYLCQHALVHHRFATGIRFLIDVRHLAAGWSDGMWATLGERAAGPGWRCCLGLALGLARELLGLEQDATRFAWPEVEPEQLAWAERMLWEMPRATIDWAAAQSWSLSALPQRALSLLRHVFLAPEAMSRTYGIAPHGLQLWAHYFWRPLDLLNRYGRALLGIWAGSGRGRDLWRHQLAVERWVRGLEAPGADGA